MPLITGDQAKRYEVLLRSTTETMPSAAPQAMLKAAVEAGLGSMLDRRVVTALIGWLVRNRGAWEKDSALFTVNLTSTALHDEHFLKFVELCLVKSALPAGTIGFEFDVPAALKPGIDIGAIATALHRLRCPLVLDNFALRTECIDLLRLPGVKFIKLAPAVTSRMRIDKLAQAAITAMVQMARVLGMQTVAKHVNSAKEHQWLTAFGVDFIQSNTVAPPAAIESLAAGQVAAR
jgi:EAL domain-containing protein (putative c-di-GMP-specific phosphodiesterase class I)